MSKLIYPKLSYQIVGALFNVYNELKYGHSEKIYQRAIEQEFKNNKLSFQKELYCPIKYHSKIIGSYYFDFLIDHKIILEIKVYNEFQQKDINQIVSYLKLKNLHLGILALFSKNALKFRRILN